MKYPGVLLSALSCWNVLHAAADEQVFLHGIIDDIDRQQATNPIKVAIIGAGAAGSSAAYHLSQFAADANLTLTIDLFERNSYIGGRSTTVDVYGDASLPVELGASIFVEVNHILVDAVRVFNLSASGLGAEAGADDETRVPGPPLAIWDGARFVLTQSEGSGWWDLARLMWKYGIAPLRTVRLMRQTVNRFLKLYDAPNFPFASLTAAARDVDLLAATAATGEQYMHTHGITGSFGREVVQASTRVNYAQNLGFIHGLEAMVCMATSGAMAVDGGNWQIFDAMAKRSGAAVHLDTAVGGVWPQAGRGYALNYSRTDNSESGSGLFDVVVLAAPYQFADLRSLGAEQLPDNIPYVGLHVTLLASPNLLSPAFFNLSSAERVPRTILTTLPAHESAEKGPDGVGSPGFFSISLLQPVTNPTTASREYVYKIFSPAPPNATFLASLLGVSCDADIDDKDDSALLGSGAVSWIHRKLWHSYPYEYPRVTFEEARLARNLWYTGGMDSFISTMETNALMGKNVARLIVDEHELTREAGDA